MTNEKEQVKSQTVDEVKTDQKDQKEAPPNVSVQDILGSYPIDRDKCRDVLMVEMSGSLGRIAHSLEGIMQGLIVVNTHLAEMNASKKKRHHGL